MADAAAAALERAEFEQIQLLRDPASGARAVIAIHDTRRGPAFGGIRRRRYADLRAALDDVMRLAEAMTWKCAMADLPGGGAKAVLLDDDGLDRPAAYAFLGSFVEQLRGRFFTGPDVGTGDDELRAVCRRTRYCVDPDQPAYHGVSASTARGVFAALQATAAVLGRELAGLRVLVQGLGAVGARLAALLAEAGAALVVCDVDAAAVARAVAAHGATVVPADAATRTPCDVFAPCAFGGVVTRAVAAELPALAVCGAANNVLADAAAGAVLHGRGVLLAPDFVANAGGLLHGGGVQLGRTPPDAARLQALGDTVRALLERSRRDDAPPTVLAVREARRRVAAAPARPFLPQ